MARPLAAPSVLVEVPRTHHAVQGISRGGIAGVGTSGRDVALRGRHGGHPGGFDLVLQGEKWMRQTDDLVVIIDKNSLEGVASRMSEDLTSYFKFSLTPG